MLQFLLHHSEYFQTLQKVTKLKYILFNHVIFLELFK